VGAQAEGVFFAFVRQHYACRFRILFSVDSTAQAIRVSLLAVAVILSLAC
jgi:hypothetical protein